MEVEWENDKLQVCLENEVFQHMRECDGAYHEEMIGGQLDTEFSV